MLIKKNRLRMCLHYLQNFDGQALPRTTCMTCCHQVAVSAVLHNALLLTCLPDITWESIFIIMSSSVASVQLKAFPNDS